MAKYKMSNLQSKRISEEVRAYNTALTNLEKQFGWEKGALPRENVKHVKSLIKSNDDFRRLVGYETDYENRPSIMQRLRANKAMQEQITEVDFETGNIVETIRYFKEMPRARVEMENANRRMRVEDEAMRIFGKPMSQLTEMEQVSIYQHGDFVPLTGDYTLPEKLRELDEIVNLNRTKEYAYRFIDEWDENVPDNVEGKYELEAQLERFITEAPDEYYDIISRGDVEAQFEYIYTGSQSAYKNEAFNKRIKNTMEYWEKEYERVFGEESSRARSKTY